MSQPHHILGMVIEEVRTILAHLMHFHIHCIYSFAAMGAENSGKTHPQLYALITPEPLSESAQILKANEEETAHKP